MAVPIAQMYWPYSPSLRFPAMAVASQVFSWILGWLIVQLLNRLVYNANSTSNVERLHLNRRILVADNFSYRRAVLNSHSDGISTSHLATKDVHIAVCRYISFRQKWAPELVERKDRGMIIQWRRGGGFLLLLLMLLTWTQFSGFSSSPILALSVMAIVVGGTLRRRMQLRNPGSEEIISHDKHYRNLMRAAVTYDEWAVAASMLDMDSALNEWKLYDEGFVLGKLEELQARRTQGSIDDVLFSLRDDLTRNLGNICNPRLHKGRQQLPLVVQDYIEEVRYKHFRPVEVVLSLKFTRLSNHWAFIRKLIHHSGAGFSLGKNCVIFEPRCFCPPSGAFQLMQFHSTETPFHNKDTDVTIATLHTNLEA